MNTNTRRLGLISSWSIFFLMIFVSVIILSPLFMPHNRVWQSAITTYYKKDPAPGVIEKIGYYAHFITAPLILILFACFHDLARRPHKIFSTIALSFVIIATTFRIVALIGYPVINEFEMDICDDHHLSYAIYNLVKDLISPFYGVSITVLPGMAELFLIPVFSGKNRVEKNLRTVFLVSGIMMILPIVPIEITDFFNSGLILVLGQIFIIVVMIYCIKFFRQAGIEKEQK